MTPTNSDVCGRCGHRHDEHVQVTTMGATPIAICPTAVFLKDELQALIDTP